MTIETMQYKKSLDNKKSLVDSGGHCLRQPSIFFKADRDQIVVVHPDEYQVGAVRDLLKVLAWL